MKNNGIRNTDEDQRELRRGWTTGACATAAAKASYIGFLTGQAPNEVQITLPGGQTPIFLSKNPTLQKKFLWLQLKKMQEMTLT